ncbi:hypothetical protein [Lentilactobacillus kefiri]|uniref:hypothetical protein n=1 Tax=Lentilactobacillus kefiri TaxID=33962 RepID=UPI002072B984|nr:hypothetical protein [Lentilactobacillus kefiri]
MANLALNGTVHGAALNGKILFDNSGKVVEDSGWIKFPAPNSSFFTQGSYRFLNGLLFIQGSMTQNYNNLSRPANDGFLIADPNKYDFGSSNPIYFTAYSYDGSRAIFMTSTGKLTFYLNSGIYPTTNNASQIARANFSWVIPYTLKSV